MIDTRTEYCENCRHDTEHTVRIERWVESTKQENAKYSRQPYRVLQCEICREMRAQRMNTA